VSAQAERPLLRYQTSNFTTKLASLKLSDLTGEQVTSVYSRVAGGAPPRADRPPRRETSSCPN